MPSPVSPRQRDIGEVASLRAEGLPHIATHPPHTHKLHSAFARFTNLPTMIKSRKQQSRTQSHATIFGLSCRGGGIRTRDPLLPKQVR